MSGRASPPVAPARRPGSRASRGFTLLELVVAFAILAVVIVTAMEVQAGATAKAAKARDLRELRILADTVFRRIVYEGNWKWTDGMTGTADEWYADFAGFADSAKHRWRVYRLELHKKKGMVAGTDPTGKVGTLFEGDDSTTTTTNPSSTTSGSTGTPGSSTGSTTPGSEDPSVGEPAYEIELDVYSDDSEEPAFRLRSVVPVPDKEREEEAK